MNRFLLCLLAALLVVTFSLSPCVAAPAANGVICQERVISLPADQGKWYVSVVGDPNDARFREIQSWFESNTDLVKLRMSTNYCVVTDGSAIFNERYEPNTPALPMVRIQNAEGVIYSQLCEDEIPLTATTLSAKIADDVSAGPKTGCILRSIRQWRKEHYLPTLTPIIQQNPKPEPKPLIPLLPDLRPGPLDELKPVLPNRGQEVPWWLLAPVCLIAFSVGSVAGAVCTVRTSLKNLK